MFGLMPEVEDANVLRSQATLCLSCEAHLLRPFLVVVPKRPECKHPSP